MTQLKDKDYREVRRLISVLILGKLLLEDAQYLEPDIFNFQAADLWAGSVVGVFSSVNASVN